MNISYFSIFIIFALVCKCCSLTLESGNATIILTNTNEGISLTLSIEGITKLSGLIGSGYNFELLKSSPRQLLVYDSDINFMITDVTNGFNIYWHSKNASMQFRDCFTLNRNARQWFAGREGQYTEWPVQNSRIQNEPYVVKTENGGSVLEAYWLSSDGAVLLVNETTPLFVDQNNLFDDRICLIGKIDEPYLDRNEVSLNYTVAVGINSREAHLNAITSFVGRPVGVPASEMVRFPLWSTWKKYQDDISDQLLYDFAQSIEANQFRGQVQIDDGWEECYGSLIFKKIALADIEMTIMKINSFALRVMLTVHPFVNADCEEYVNTGKENDYFVKSADGTDLITSWWNGNLSYLIDFTKEDAKNWFLERVQDVVTTYRLDGVKFVAGETSWAPDGALLQGGPNLFTTDYNSIANITTYAHVHSGWRTQWVPVFVSMTEKESNWSLENGLRAVIVNLIQLNLAGYTMVLPSVIGGSGHASPELYVRWVQAVALMPVMQFGDLPWEIISPTFDVLSIVKKGTDLHYRYADKINNVLKKSVSTGLPVNAPVWWIDPDNPEAFTIIDQYLLGEDFLIAPILDQGAVTRDVYLPPGTWEDGNNGTKYEGNRIIKDYPAPIDILPYFIKDRE